MMKRITSRFSALIFGLTIMAAVSINAYAVDMSLLGYPVSIERDGLGTIHTVNVLVKGGWTNTDAIELDITIDSINNEPQFHGHQIVSVSEATLDINSVFRDTAEVGVAWNELGEVHRNMTYKVCVQILAKGNPIGEQSCNDFYF